MKLAQKFITALLALMAISFTTFAQDAESTKEKAACESEISINMDIMSSYVWRGSAFGTGPAFQPNFDYTCGNFSMGVWNSISAGSDQAIEIDPYLSYSFPFPVTLGVTNYNFGGKLLGNNFDNFLGDNAVEPFMLFEYSDELSFYAGIMFMADGEKDVYLELTYSFPHVDFAVGAGDGAYLMNPDFGTIPEDVFSICNMSLSTTKEIEITDKFSLPMSGAITFNPYTERIFATVGISL